MFLLNNYTQDVLEKLVPKAFLKNKKRSGISLPVLFSALFLKKIITTLYLIIKPNFITDSFYFLRYWAVVYCNYLLSSLCSRSS